jgi:hypothetical protein
MAEVARIDLCRISGPKVSVVVLAPVPNSGKGITRSGKMTQGLVQQGDRRTEGDYEKNLRKMVEMFIFTITNLLP